MNDDIKFLLFQIAGFLNVLPQMQPDVVERERLDLLNKIGNAIAKEQA